MQQIHIKQIHYPSGIVRNFANGSKSARSPANGFLTVLQTSLRFQSTSAQVVPLSAAMLSNSAMLTFRPLPQAAICVVMSSHCRAHL